MSDRAPRLGDVIDDYCPRCRLLLNHDVTSLFEEQVASHGGLGGPQDWPFLASPPGERLAVRAIENSEEVYTRLVGAYGGYS